MTRANHRATINIARTGENIYVDFETPYPIDVENPTLVEGVLIMIANYVFDMQEKAERNDG